MKVRISMQATDPNDSAGTEPLYEDFEAEVDDFCNWKQIDAALAQQWCADFSGYNACVSTRFSTPRVCLFNVTSADSIGQVMVVRVGE